MSTTVTDKAAVIQPNKSASQALADGDHRIADATFEQQPLVVIEPTKGWSSINLGDIWRYRELLYFLAWRDVKVRYKQTVLGIVWVILQPLASTIIFTIILGKLARVPTNGIPYPILVYAGLLPWTFFSNAVSGAAVSLVSNSYLVTKIFFPRMIIPISGVGGRLLDFAIAFVILIGMMIYYHVPLTRNLLMLPVLITMLVLLTLGFALLSGALNVKYRDISVVLPVLIQLGMFVSPVLYSTTLVPPRWRSIYSLNPLVGIIDGFRASLIAQPFNWQAIGISAVFSIALLTLSAYVFRAVERGFADIV